MQALYSDDCPEEELQELTLDALRLAFAEDEDDAALNAKNGENEPAGQQAETLPPEEDANEEDGPDDDEEQLDKLLEADSADKIAMNPQTILEAVLFVGDQDSRPIAMQRVADLMRNVTPEEMIEATAELNRQYKHWGTPYRIVPDGDGFRMTLCEDFEPIRQKFYGKAKETQLSQQAIDILAVVAYRQPVSADEVQQIRKSPVSGILGQLVRRELLSVESVLRGRRRISLYRTTPRFLTLFGLRSLDDLPTANDLDFQ